MRDEDVYNWRVKKSPVAGYDDLPDDYIIDEDGKMVIMPTEELYDDGSDEDEDSSDEEKKGALSGSADTRERRAVADEFRRTGKGQGYDKLTTPSQVAAYRSSYGLGPAKPGSGSNPPPGPAPMPNQTLPPNRPRPAPMPNQTVPSNPPRRPAPMPNIPSRRTNDPGFKRPAPDLRRRPAPMPIYRGNETNDQGFMKSAEQPLRDPKGGLTAAGRKHFKETEGANLKPGVKGAADTPTKMRRKGSFLVRFFTNPTGPMVDPKGRPTRLALSARAWGEPVPRNLEDAAKLAAKGRRLLDRYRSSKEESKGQKSFKQFQLSMKSDEYSKALTDQQAAGLREAGKFFGDKDKGKGRIQKFYSDTRSTGNTIPRPNTPVSRRGSRDSQLRGYDRAVSYARSRGGSEADVAKPRFMSDSQIRGYDRAVSHARSLGGSAADVAKPRFMDGKTGNPNDGMIEPGNIDTSKRRAVKLPGGDYGTVRSMGINDNGKEVLIPTIGPRGENWSGPKGEQRARDHYKTTGQHLGKFNSVAASNTAGKRLHEIEANRINKPRKAYNTTGGTMDTRERASAAEGRDINSNLTRPIRKSGWSGQKSADIPGRPHGGIRPSMPSGSFTGSPGGTNRGRVGETGTITASGRTTQRVYSGGRKNSRSLMAEGPNPSSYSRDKYFLVNESGNHPYDDSKGEYESQWDDEAEAMMPYDENEKSFDIPGRPHGGVAPKMPKGAWTGSPGGTTHRSGRNLPRTASGRMRQEMNNSNNLDDDAYPRDKYFLVTPDNKPFER